MAQDSIEVRGTAKIRRIVISRKVTEGRINFTLNHSDGTDPITIYYESNAPDFTRTLNDDGILCATANYAMRCADHVHLHGIASEKLLLGLSDYQKAWSRWRPDRYSETRITADKISAEGSNRTNAIAAYSGGVDAVHLIVKNAVEQQGQASHHLSACLLVHGFDVPLSDMDAFTVLKERARDLHNSLGFEFYWVRTNSKLKLRDWKNSFAAQLMGCMHLFSSQFSSALIGSSEAYDELVIPWGSSPITDHLLSGSAMEAVHFGAGYSRTEKVETISKHPFAVEQLRVCWQSTDKTKNCGFCEKCIRTRLNFMAVGLQAPSCFGQPFDPAAISSIQIRNPGQMNELRIDPSLC